jgi:peptidoglycan/xylan/chitin deacetylase (PgdA/CDA1 family)
VIAVALLAAAGVLVWYLIAAPRSQWMGPTLSAGASDVPEVALTFDDGPGPQTPQILDALKAASVHATFFLCGANVEQHPAIARRIQAEGHEIGNHTHSHPRLLGRTPGAIALEIDRAQKVIEAHTGVQPRVFRPPYGLRWFGLFPILAQRKLHAVMWSVDPLDWRRSQEEIRKQVLACAHPGAIILLHDGMPPRESGTRQATVLALPPILGQLKTRYRLVTVSELRTQRPN